MKKIALIGSTGSIGRQVINVALRYPDRFKIVALIANASLEALLSQLEVVKPQYAALSGVRTVPTDLPQGTEFAFGSRAATEVISKCNADVVVVACGGFAGLKYSLEAVRLGLPLALANKESLVCGGELIMPKVKRIMPVDSEHSAIWQCLGFDLKKPFERLILTASGGAFRGRRWEDLSSVTPDEALCHPTWKMGKKITVDCATLLNKGYEVIEAHHLYGAPYENISAVVHPQSIIHSMVQFADGATLMQASYPTMELPIQLALTYPERLDVGLERLDFDKIPSLKFEPLDIKNYPLFALALECGQKGGILPTALNAACEVAVDAFLAGMISYTDIYNVAYKVVASIKNGAVESYERLADTDDESRRRAREII